MRSLFKLAALPLAASAALVSPASAAIIFNSLTVSASSEATMTPGASDSDTTSVTYLALPSTGFNVTSNVVNGSNSQANAQTSVAVFFPDAAAFSFDATSTTSLVFRNAATGTAKAGKYTFIYNFTATKSFNYTVDWDVAAPNVIQPTNGPNIFGVIVAPTSNGQFGCCLPGSIAPGTYVAVITADFQDMLSQAGTDGQIFRGSSSDHFNFQITEVPEPAAWGLMLLGFGAVGTAMRRRKGEATVFA